MRPRRPPDPKKRHAGRAPGAIVETGQQQSPQHSRDRREFQGKGNGRAAMQLPPRWDAPRGSRAADDLAAAFTGPGRRFFVVIETFERKAVFGRYCDLGAAQDVAAKLRRHGMDAHVEVAT